MQAQSPFYSEAPETGVIILDEELQRQTEISERRKAQNRLAQRNFRKRRSQQQQGQQPQEKEKPKRSDSKASSYPSPRPSPQSSYRSVKSPERSSISRGADSRERSSSISQLGSSSSSSGSSSAATPMSMQSPHDFLPLEQDGMNASYHGVHNGPNPMAGGYPGHFDHTVNPMMMNNHMQFDSGMYDPTFSVPLYGNGIRPAVIPRTEGSTSRTGSPYSPSSFGDARRPSTNGSTSMSIDLTGTAPSDFGMKTMMSPNPHSASGSMASHNLSPGLSTSGRGEMSLHLSAEKGHEGIVRLLLDCGADPNGRDDYGSTPLHLAAKHGDEQVVQALLDKGADVNAKNANGWSVVHIASKYGHEKILRLLIQRGADLNAKASDSKQRKGSITG